MKGVALVEDSFSGNIPYVNKNEAIVYVNVYIDKYILLAVSALVNELKIAKFVK